VKNHFTPDLFEPRRIFRRFRRFRPPVASPPVFPYREGMEVHFTPAQETQLAQIATKAGTDAEQLVKDTILRLIKDEIFFRRPAPELPEWDLGIIGSLHRRDLYEDVR
jgi:hypothetical protein